MVCVRGTSWRLVGVASLALLAVVTTVAPARADRVEQVKDIDPSVTAASSGPIAFVDLGGVAVFSATDSRGRELWVTDGTEAGTRILRDLCPGSCDGAPQSLTPFGGGVLFAGNDSVAGTELWFTDGTPEGTRLVKDICPGSSGSGPLNLTRVGDHVFFTAYLSTTGTELWKTDGTEAGTTMVTEIVAGATGASFAELRSAGSLLYFEANDTVHGAEPWVSDGTAGGTHIVMDVVPGSTGSYPSMLRAAGDWFYFAAEVSASGRELWRTDGTEANTQLVVDLNPGAANGVADYTPSVAGPGGVLLFAGTQTATGTEFWRTDGTPSGTWLVSDIRPGSVGSDPSDFVDIDGTIYFDAEYGPSYKPTLFTTDGTAAGTQVHCVTDAVSRLVKAGSNLYYIAYLVSGNENEVYVSPGPGDCHLLKQVNPTGNGNPQSLTAFGDRLLFSSTDGVRGQEPWITDGTTDGTDILKDVYAPELSGDPTGFLAVGNRVYFAAKDVATGTELWSSDGTEGGTSRIKDIWSGTSSSSPALLTLMNGTVYFTANDGSTGVELWRSNGTEAGTTRVADLYTGGASYSSNPTKLTAVGTDKLFFVARNNTYTGELFVHDRIANSTYMVKDIKPFYSANPDSLVSFNGKLYFSVDDGSIGNELWTSDGTSAGTVPVLDLYPGTSGSGPNATTVFANRLYFSASGPTGGRELWSSDGTAGGTAVVADIHPSGSSSPAKLTVGDNVLFFTADDGSTGIELWKTDGTPAGTVRVADINPGTASSSPDNLRFGGGRLHFTANDGVHGTELWVSDGTEAGTHMLDDLAAGTASPTLASLAAVERTLFFQYADPVLGAEGFVSDGTVATVLGDIYPGTDSSTPSGFTKAGQNVFFAATDPGGRELWAVRNADPVASAADVHVPEGRPATVDASGSTDPDGDPLGFEWRGPDGAVLASTATATLSLGLGSHPLTLYAYDGYGGGSRRVVDVSVETPVMLDVQLQGENIQATVTSSLWGDACVASGGPVACAFGYLGGDVVTLTAVEGTKTRFVSWGGACSGTGTCVVTMDGPRTVTADFTADPVFVSAASVNLLAEPVGTTGAPRTVTLVNLASAAASLAIELAGANPGDFAVVGSTCGASLAGHASCSFGVTLTPTAEGQRTATVGITADGWPHTVSLLGYGYRPLFFSTSMIRFATAQSVGTTSSPYVVTARNLSPTALSLSGFGFTGANPGDFAVAATTCGASLAPGATCTVDVTFTPSATGARTGVLGVTANGEPYTVDAAGYGRQTLFLSSSLIRFAPGQTVGTTSPAYVVTLWNLAPAALALSGFSFTGANPGDFAVAATTCGANLAAGATCTVDVTFTPSATGWRNAVLNVTADGALYTVDSTGYGVTELFVSAALVRFPSQPVGVTSAPFSVTVWNTSPGPLALSGFAVGGANPGDFATGGTTCGTSLAAGAMCSFEVTFTPSASGARSGNVSFTAGAPTYTVNLAGAGL